METVWVSKTYLTVKVTKSPGSLDLLCWFDLWYAIGGVYRPPAIRADPVISPIYIAPRPVTPKQPHRIIDPWCIIIEVSLECCSQRSWHEWTRYEWADSVPRAISYLRRRRGQLTVHAHKPCSTFVRLSLINRVSLLHTVRSIIFFMLYMLCFLFWQAYWQFLTYLDIIKFVYLLPIAQIK